MVVGEMPEAVDLLVVGAGPAGSAAAFEGARLGRRVLVVDRGDPTPLALEHHRFSVVPPLQQATDYATGALDIEHRRGDLTFVRPGIAVVRTPDDRAEFLEFRDVVIATGATPGGSEVVPEFLGAVSGSASSPHVVTTCALDPASFSGPLVVLGGDGRAIGAALRAASAGIDVTLVFEDGLLPEVQGPARAAALALLRDEVLERESIVPLSGVRVVGLEPGGLSVIDGHVRRRIDADVVAAHIPLRGATDELGLGEIGVGVSVSGAIVVDVTGIATAHVAGAGAVVDTSCGPDRAAAEGRAAAATVSGHATPRPWVVADPILPHPTSFVVVGPGPGAGTGPEGVSPQFDVVRVPRRAAPGEVGAGAVAFIVEEGSGRIVAAVIVGRTDGVIDALLVAIELGATLDDLALMALSTGPGMAGLAVVVRDAVAQFAAATAVRDSSHGGGA